MAPYQYSQLNEDLGEIRVLTLQPGDFSADIQISIQTLSLTAESSPIYEALSYVWGTKDNPVNIKVGLSNNDELTITQNLAVALPYLRYKNKIRTLWIDAICIDQQNIRERSSQVRRIADIFRSADHVVVWLGVEKDNSTHVLKILSLLSSEIKVDYGRLTMSPASSQSAIHWSDMTTRLPYMDDEVCDIVALFNRSWFSRLWVWQEIRLARSNPTMVCGWDTIPWQSLRQVIFCLYYKQWGHAFENIQNKLYTILNISYFAGPVSNSLGEIIQRTAQCKCSDPRDRIYAVLSLLDTLESDITIEPDYAKTTAQVYEDLVLQLLEHQGSLNILLYCELRNGEPAMMPTWVPNWLVLDRPGAFGSGSFGWAASKAKACYKEGGILSATGFISATISQVEETRLEQKTTSVIDGIRRLAPADIEHRAYVSGGSLLDAFVITICANNFNHIIQSPRADHPRFEMCRATTLVTLQDIDSYPTFPHGSDAWKFFAFIFASCYNRTFITTEEGYIGLAPKATRPYDKVCFLLGCPRHMVLRPTSGFLEYQVVGECYIHGLDNGEAFLGPLPDTFQFIKAYNQNNYLVRAFKNSTGNIQYNDPRIEAHDQIITQDLLERRGVQLQTLDLI